MLFKLLQKNLLMFYTGVVPYFLSYILIILVSTFQPIYGQFLSYGVVAMFFFSSYILDNASIDQQKKFLVINYGVNLLFGIIYFMSYKGLLPLCQTSTKILFFIVGTTLPTGTNHFLQIIKLYYVDFFSFILNFFTGMLWILIGAMIYFKHFLITYSSVFFLIYVVTMLVLILTIANEDQIDDKKPLSIMDNYKLIIKDKNYWIVTFFFIIVLHVQFYFVINMDFNIYYNLLGGVLGCVLYYYVLPRTSLKNGFIWSLICTVWMLVLPNPLGSICSGLVASSCFLSCIYVLNEYYYNMCKIFATWNIINFFSKTIIIVILHSFNLHLFMPIRYFYIFILTAYALYISSNYRE